MWFPALFSFFLHAFYAFFLLTFFPTRLFIFKYTSLKENILFKSRLYKVDGNLPALGVSATHRFKPQPPAPHLMKVPVLEEHLIKKTPMQSKAIWANNTTASVLPVPP